MLRVSAEPPLLDPYRVGEKDTNDLNGVLLGELK